MSRVLSTWATEAHAPGKLLLTGEYAVLTGAPAIVVAVGVQAAARLSPSAQMQLNVDGRLYPFVVEPAGRLHWSQPAPAGRGELVETVMAELSAVGYGQALLPVEIRLDSSEFSVAGAAGERLKLGLGSSAAVLVSLLAALNATSQLGLDVDRLRALACAAHRRFQGDRGSGVDVMTAVHGSVLALRRDQAGKDIQPETLGWPDGLELVMVWSGQPASTPAMIARLEAFGARRPTHARCHLELLTDKAGQAVDAWRTADVGRIMTSSADYFQALRNLDRDAGIGIVTAAHERLRLLAEREGAVYKTSGAGGGDLGLAMADDPEIAARVRFAFEAAGHTVIDRPLAVPGVCVGPV